MCVIYGRRQVLLLSYQVASASIDSSHIYHSYHQPGLNTSQAKTFQEE